MTDFNYKKYQLEKLEEWIYDCLTSDEVSPYELYNVIVRVAEENQEYFRKHEKTATDFLTLLHGKPVIKCATDDTSPECRSAWTSFWEESYYPEEYNMNFSTYNDMELPKEDKVVKWRLPVEMDAVSGEYFIQFPDDLLEAANMQEGDEVSWVDNKNGTFTLKKITRPLRMDEC